MGRIRARWPPMLPGWLGGDRLVALLLLLAVFGLYGVTTGPADGYEDETSAVTEGLVKTGELRVLDHTQLTTQGIPGRLGHRYSRTGLTEPLLEAPFYFVGWKLDEATSSGRNYKWRLAFLRLYNPAMAAVAIVAIFLILRLYNRSRRRALGVAALAATGSMIWPYASIGLETTLIATVAVMVLALSWASRKGGLDRYGLAGMATGAAIAAKPIGVVLLVGVFAFVGPVLKMPRREQARVLLAFGAPLLVWIAAIAWYNAYRTGSITNFSNTYGGGSLFEAPVGWIGMTISPGKGLLWYSPLTILGLLGLRTLWRAERQLALAIALIFLANLLVISGSRYWVDELWGPRYLSASALLLLLPIAWWLEGWRRRRVLAWVATLAVVVQVAGVFAWYGVVLVLGRDLSGEPTFAFLGDVGTLTDPAVAYGNDGPTWIPAASPLKLRVELLAAWIDEKVSGKGFVIHYAPALGRRGAIDLSHPSQALGGAVLPDFWWNYPGQTTALYTLAIGLATLSVGASAGLIRIMRPPRDRAATALEPHAGPISSS